MKLLAFFLIILFTPLAEAYENQFSVAAGVGWRATTFRSESISDDLVFGTGPSFMTSVSYRWTHIELGVQWMLTYGLVSKLDQRVQDSEVYGSYYYRCLSIGPIYRYYSHMFILNQWEVYYMGGPQQELMTMLPNKQNVTVSGGHYNKSNVIKYEGQGGIIGIGIGKKTSRNTEWMFYQLSYRQVLFHKLSVVGPENRDTNVITEEKMGHRMWERTLSFNIGAVLF